MKNPFKKKSTMDIVGSVAEPEDTGYPEFSETSQADSESEVPPTTKKEKKPKARKPKKEKKPKPAGTGKPPILKNRVFLGAICVAVAAFVAFGLTPITRALTSGKTQIIQLSADAARGTRITADILQSTEIHKGSVPEGAITDPQSVLGLYTAIDMMSGDALTAKKLTAVLPYDDPYLAELPEDKLAISVAMRTSTESLSGKLRAGDIVRLYYFMSDSTEMGNYTAVSLPELQYVEVLAVTNSNLSDLDTKNDGLSDAENADKQISNLTLCVNNEQATVLAGLNNAAVLHAALVSRGDVARAESLLELQDAYFLPEEPAEEIQTEVMEQEDEDE